MMFDFHKFYDRIAKQLPNDCKICEVGVADGQSALYLASKLNELGKTFTLYMVDNLDYGKYIQLCTIYENIIQSGLGGSIKVIPKDSIEASKDFNDGYLDFAFIDSSHLYEPTKLEIKAWYEKVKDEGIISGHDAYDANVYRAIKEVIPQTFTRTDIADRTFEPEDVLHIENTDSNYGIWWAKKQWYIKLNEQ